jgi:mannose-1-phosphate guanylyltransferase
MIVPVILSGGSGTRLWPLSRKQYPKQFISLINNSTLFQDTITRLPDYLESPLIICNEEHRFIVAEQLRQINSKNKGIILEPIGKNTAPAISIAALHLLSKFEDPTLLVLSADHIIEEGNEFNSSIKISSDLASRGEMVAIGVNPNRPETGYGYIEIDKSMHSDKYSKIISFKEKPSFETAEKYFNAGNYLWNSGIFIFKASTYLNELNKYETEILNICKKTFSSSTKDLDFIRLNYDDFNLCPEKSIDYAIMEKTKIGSVVSFNAEWSDIGSWDSLWQAKNKDRNNNVIEGDVLASKVKNSFISSSSRLIAANDVSDLIIVDTQDSLLISSKDKSQEVKNIVLDLQNKGRSEANNHRKVYRPWGYYDTVDSGKGFKVKRILVNPGAKISLQKHLHRAEHWIIVTGVAKITCGKKMYQLKESESTYIPKGEIHRIENLENSPLEVIEIQTGDYLGEDDIIRYIDEYKRN